MKDTASGNSGDVTPVFRCCELFGHLDFHLPGVRNQASLFLPIRINVGANVLGISSPPVNDTPIRISLGEPPRGSDVNRPAQSEFPRGFKFKYVFAALRDLFSI